MKSSRKNVNTCIRCAKQTSLCGLFAGIFLAFFKLTIGVLGGSRALVASGLCNVSDISSAIAVFIGVRFSQKSVNKRYQYGYGKVEFIVQVVISGLMILGNIFLIYSSFIVLAQRSIVIPHMVVFFTAILSAVINGLIYKFANCGAKELNSPALRSHAEHNKIDVASSLLVAIGVLAARVGLHWADPVIAIFESIHIIYGSFVIFWEGLKGLMDTSPSQEYLTDIKKKVSKVKDVRHVKRVWARQSGPKVFLEIVIEINPDLSVLESKRVTQNLKAQLRAMDRHIKNIFVQVMPSKVTLRK